MADPFELWRLMWSFAISGGLEQLAQAVPGATVAARPRVAYAIELSTFPTLGHVRMELATMVLLEQPEPSRAKVPPVVIVAPYAVHDASVADFAPGHSLAQTLAEADAGSIALTFWKSATAEMRDYGIDAYLGDLNVAIDDLGGRASLVGLCQGGWLAAAYAARFPGKVARLVLAGAPIDPSAAESRITQALAAVPPAAVESLVAMTGGRISGALPLALWSQRMEDEYSAEAALQCAGDSALNQRFDAWNARTVDLPGVYFLEVAEWLFRENRLFSRARPPGPIVGHRSADVRPRGGRGRDRRLAAGGSGKVAVSRNQRRSSGRAGAASVAVHGPANLGRRLAGDRALVQGRSRRRIAESAGSPIARAALRRRRGVGAREAVRSCFGKDAAGQLSPADWVRLGLSG